MALSRQTKLVAGITLLAVPTIQYGGLALLGVLTRGSAGIVPGGLVLDDIQWALWRAGHAHAGVWLVFSLLIQLLLDSARLTSPLQWVARIAAPVAAVAISAGFFGVAFLPGFRWLLYFGAGCLFVATILSGIGLLRNLQADG
ncbi:MAG TPA: hypothetical protein VFB04_08355 [Terriglobales bacterium]|nr:hypothetical protein [Terriglobales bacterium]